MQSRDSGYSRQKMLNMEMTGRRTKKVFVLEGFLKKEDSACCIVNTGCYDKAAAVKHDTILAGVPNVMTSLYIVCCVYTGKMRFHTAGLSLKVTSVFRFNNSH